MILPLLALLLAPPGADCVQLESATIRPSSGDALLRIANKCGADALAIAADVVWVLDDGTRVEDHLSLDTWPSVAAHKAFGVTKQWLVDGAARDQLRRWPQGLRRPPEGVEMRVVAVERIDGVILGATARLEDVLKTREASKQAWGELERRIERPLGGRRPVDACLKAIGESTEVATPLDVARRELRAILVNFADGIRTGSMKENDARNVLKSYVAARAGR